MKRVLGPGLRVRFVGLLFAVCGCAGSEAWRNHTVALEVEGVTFVGDRIEPASWAGIGVRVAPGRVLAAAQTVVRSRIIRVPSSQTASEVHFVGYDRDSEAAVVRFSGELADEGAVAEWAETDTGAELDAVHPSFGGGDALARVLAVVGTGRGQRVLLDRDLPRGALLFEPGGRFVGLVSGGATGRSAVPATLLVELGRNGPGVPLDIVFTPNRAARWMDAALARRTCLAPGEALALPWSGDDASDLVVNVEPENGSPPLALGLRQGAVLAWRGTTDRERTIAFGGGFATRSIGTALAILVVNPARSGRPACAMIRAGGVAWGRALESSFLDFDPDAVERFSNEDGRASP